jgi:stalled ribosome rescue protein Dom34
MATTYYALWVDHAHAFIYKYTANGVEETKIDSHIHADRVDNEAKHKMYEKFYHDLTGKMSDAQELMIMGPRTAKDEFKHHLDKHHHQKLAKVVVGVETMRSHPTTAMMREKAGDFFKEFHLWTKNY